MKKHSVLTITAATLLALSTGVFAYTLNVKNNTPCTILVSTSNGNYQQVDPTKTLSTSENIGTQLSIKGAEQVSDVCVNNQNKGYANWSFSAQVFASSGTTLTMGPSVSQTLSITTNVDGNSVTLKAGDPSKVLPNTKVNNMNIEVNQ